MEKKGCLGIIVLVAVLALFGIGATACRDIIEATMTEEEKAERDARRAAAEAEKWAKGAHCVVGADTTSVTGDNTTGPWSCKYCFSFAIDNAIKQRLRASGSYDSGTLAWDVVGLPTGEVWNPETGELLGKVPPRFKFIQGFTAQNVYGATLDYRAVGEFASSNCKVLSIEIVDGR